jgi:hypothetical protein
MYLSDQPIIWLILILNKILNNLEATPNTGSLKPPLTPSEVLNEINAAPDIPVKEQMKKR